MEVKEYKWLQGFVEEVEVKLGEDKYTPEQVKKLAEASPKIIELCGKAVVPFIKDSGEKSSALENARIDVAKKLIEKLKNEGVENLKYSALKSIVEFSLYSLKSEIGYRIQGAENDFKGLSPEEMKEFFSRDEYFIGAVDAFFDVIKDIEKEKIGMIDRIKNIFKNLA